MIQLGTYVKGTVGAILVGISKALRLLYDCLTPISLAVLYIKEHEVLRDQDDAERLDRESGV